MSNSEGEPKKGMSGCAIAAIIVGALGVLVVAGVVVAMALVVRSPQGQGVIGTMNAAATSMTGPAVDAMKAIGCATPSSMDLSPVAAVVRSLAKDDADAQKHAAEVDGMFAATCYSDSLTCEQVFAAWNNAAPSTATNVGVNVIA